MPCRRTKALRSSLVEFGPLQSISSFASARFRRFSDPAPSRRSRTVSRPVRVCLSWGSCSHGHFLRRVPLLLHAPPSRALVRGEGCHTLAGAVLRVLAPLDGFGLSHAARSRSFGPRRSPWPPTLRGLLSCRSRPWSFPPELSLPEEPCPLSRATCFLAGSHPTAASAASEGPSRPVSPLRADSSPFSSPPGGGPGTPEPGRWFPSIARPVASTHEVRRTCRLESLGSWAQR